MCDRQSNGPNGRNERSLDEINVANTPLILASQSPRRRELLAQLGVKFDVLPANIPEEIEPGETPDRFVERLAIEKAAHIAALHPKAVVIGADTIVVLPGPTPQILGKPCDAIEAMEMLRLLQDREHFVYTGFAVLNAERSVSISRVVRTKVLFKPLSDALIEAYVRTGEPMDKAGSYGVQGIGGAFVRLVEGSFTNVVGLPLAELHDELLAIGLCKPNDLAPS